MLRFRRSRVEERYWSKSKKPFEIQKEKEI